MNLRFKAANDTNSDLDRRYIQDEIDQLAAEIDRVSDTTQFNSINVLDGSYGSKVFQIGSNENQTMNISIGSMHSSVLGVATSNSAAASMAQEHLHLRCLAVPQQLKAHLHKELLLKKPL